MTPFQRQQKGRLGKMNRTDVKGERTLKQKLSSGKLSIPLPPSLLFLLKRSSKPSSKPTKIRRKRKKKHTSETASTRSEAKAINRNRENNLEEEVEGKAESEKNNS